VIAIPSMSTGRAIVVHIRSTVSLMAHTNNVAISGVALGKWLPSLVALATTIDAWLTVGPVAQAALIGAALLGRLAGKTVRGEVAT
jgi:hypothetical protein